MSGIQESSDETASLISPGITPVQAPVPPQFADEPIPQEPPPQDLSSAPLLHESIVDNASMSAVNDANKLQDMHNYNSDDEANHKGNGSHSSTRTNLNERTSTTDQSMVSFLPMSASIEDDSVVNLTRF